MAVACGVRFVKSVTREHLDLVENRVRQLLADAIGFFATFDKHRALLRHFFRLFIAHRTTQQVGAAEGIACEQFGGILHLFLIDHDAIGRTSDLL